MSNKKTEENTDQIHIEDLKLPIHVSHVKPGNTLCSNDQVILIQDGSTTIEFRLPPKFLPKKIPWRFGYIRDIVWAPNLGLFILLTRDALYSVSPQSLLTAESAASKPLADFTINTYKKIKPYDSTHLFWRCTCAGTTLYIAYSGR